MLSRQPIYSYLPLLCPFDIFSPSLSWRKFHDQPLQSLLCMYCLRNLFNFFSKQVYWWQIPFNFYLSENVFIWPLSSKDLFAGYRITDWMIFTFKTLKMFSRVLGLELFLIGSLQYFIIFLHVVCVFFPLT